MYKIGLGVESYGDVWTVTGFPRNTIRKYNDAHEFEERIRKFKGVDFEGIHFDCESDQFYAHAETKERAERFLAELEAHFAMVKEFLKSNT